MKKIIISLSIVFSVSMGLAQPVNSEKSPVNAPNFTTLISKAIPFLEIGLGYIYTTDSVITYNESESATLVVYGGVGAYFPLFTVKENLSVGVQPGLRAGLDLITPGEKNNWYVNAPLFAMVKLGSSASKLSTFPYGLGAGIGLEAVGLDVNTFGNGLNFKTKEIESMNYTSMAVVPAFTLEATLGKRPVRMTNRSRTKTMIWTIKVTGRLADGPFLGQATVSGLGKTYKTNNAKLGHYTFSAIYNF